MKKTNIPLSLLASKDVTEKEYVTAKRQNSMLWILSMVLAITPVLLILLLSGPNIYDVFFVGIVGGVGLGLVGHRVMRKAVFSEAHKAGTMRFQKYPELKKWREIAGVSEEKLTEQDVAHDG